MSSGFYLWSLTPNSNQTADPSVNWAEGQAPSTVNDSARTMMTRIREYGNDIAGAIVTSGTSTAYTVSSNQVFDTLSHLNGQVIAFTPHTTNTAGSPSVTLNVDSLGPKPVRTAPSVDIQSGVLIQGTPYAALYNNSDGAFYLFGVGSAPGVPLLAGMDYWDTTTPSTGFIFPAGQAISRTTYSAAFAKWGTTYGTGDGSTTFNVPDKTGRISAMKEASATRLTSTYFGGNSTTLGAIGGSESHALTQAELPAFKPGITITDPGHTHTGSAPTQGTNATSSGTAQWGNTNTGTGNIPLTINSASTGITAAFTNNLGSGSAHVIVQPTIICNYIIRVL